MKHIMMLSTVGLLMTTSLQAQDTGSEPDEKSLMEQGAELFFKGLRQEMEPALESMLEMAEQFGPSMLSFLEEMGPALADLVDEVQDWSAYHAPEMLPNGDIIIRKKQPEELAPEAVEPDGAPEQTDI
ncbi:hypothetical protein J7426_03605 [Tropicibacter sp. R16_0]|uniref:hypothetical protein n=1 Tax=Tropicibacter sp. R16_0 TaxID=2821102 RepID=UPI001ADCED72|nr:hypothetical protein [Tropicibacter sp. R16_0]MBO9449328.1 hypothetical protein [Tropicibacter sp. R16_0]